MLLFHGTNQHFEAFLDKDVVRATHGASADVGVFLTTHAGVAEGYARHAHARLYPGDHAATERHIAALYEKSKLAERRRDFDLAERLITEAETFEQEQKTTQEGMRVLTVEAEIRNPKVISDSRRIDK